MGSLQHLGGDRWRVKVYVGDGKQISRKFDAKGSRAARNLAPAIETALRTDYAKTEKERSQRRGSVAELVDDWLKVRGRDCSPTTMISYTRHAKAIKAKFGRIKTADLTGQAIDQWYSELVADGMTAAGLMVRHRHLRAILRHGYRYRDLTTVASDKANPGRHKPPKPRPPTEAAVQAVAAKLPIEDRQWARAVALLIHFGIRRGEVVGLRWADIGPGEVVVQHSIVEPKGGGVIVRPQPKGRAMRTVPLEQPAREILERQHRFLQAAGVTSPWVFPDLRADTSGATPRRPSSLSLMWTRHRDGLGAIGWRLHDLRHAYATTLLDHGVPINTVQAWLGHAKASTTVDIYGHSAKEGEHLGREVLRGLGSPAPQLPAG